MNLEPGPKPAGILLLSRLTTMILSLWLAHSEVQADKRENQLLQQMLFDDQGVFRVDIFVKPDDWKALKEASRTLDGLGEEARRVEPVEIFEYIPGDVSINGVFFENVGIRKKGYWGSLDAHRPSLKIKFNKYNKGDSLAGLRRLTLNNNKQDPSQLNQYLSYRLFREAGLPAPRCGFARVYVNGEDLGIYSHVESMDRNFVDHHFGDDKGTLYEGAFSDFFAGWAGNFETKFAIKGNEKRDIERLSAALMTNDAHLLEVLDKAVDLDQFLSFWSLEVLLGHWDGYACKGNNFFIFRPEGDSRFVFIPWGADSLGPDQNPLWKVEPPASVRAGSALTHRLYHHPEGRCLYRNRMRQLLTQIWHEDRLIKDLQKRREMLRPHLNISLAEHDRAFDELVAFIKSRRPKIMPELNGEPPVWPWPAREPSVLKVTGRIEVGFDVVYQLETPNSDGPLFEHPHGDSNAVFKFEKNGKQIEFSRASAWGYPDRKGRHHLVFLGNLSDANGDCYTIRIPLPEEVSAYSALGDNFKVFGGLVKTNLKGEQIQRMGMLEGRLSFDGLNTAPGGRVTGSGTFESRAFIQKEVTWNH